MDIGKPTKIYQNVNKFSLNCGNFDVFFFPFLYFMNRGLSRVEAGNPGFPRLVQVTSGGFSWWL